MDYKKLGLKCGIEIHQRLDTKQKLFCPCSAAFSEKPSGEVVRKLRPVAGETGEIDVAALHELMKKKEFHYMLYPGESCGVELDEEPPHPMNREALDTVLEIALLLNCEVPEEIQVMRKTVIDGSNTAGFQRTAIVGLDGHIETSFGRVGITNVCIEEESAQILDRGKGDTVFGLSRLGIPLVEIGTTPNIPNPKQAMEVAEKLGLILRSTGRVQRGLGTIRQDLNVSIRGGARCEIKGVQNLRIVPKTIELEVKRQKALVDRRRKVTKDVRRALPNGRTEFMRPLPGSARMYPETDIPPIEITREKFEEIRSSLPEVWADKEERFVKHYKLNEELARQIIRSGKAELFEKGVKSGAEPMIIASILTKYSREYKIGDDKLLELFRGLKHMPVSKEALEGLLKEISSKPGRDVKILLKKIKKESISDSDIREAVKKLLSEKKGLSFGAYMGLLMKEFSGKADGQKISGVLKEEIRG